MEFLILLVVFILVGLLILQNTKKSDNKSKYKARNFSDEIETDIEAIQEKSIREKNKKLEIQKRYKQIANFYNTYKIIDYGEKGNQKIAKKQMEDIVNVVKKNIDELKELTQDTETIYLIVGMITFKHTTKDVVKKVNKDLKKLYDLGQLLAFDRRLMHALEDILGDDA